MAETAVVVLGPADLAAEVAARTGLRAVTADGAGDVADAGVVVGVAAAPWPAFAAVHEEVRGSVAPAPYYAVQAWHQHPAYIEALAAAVARARADVGADVHVLFTAPGPAVEPEPHEVVFLRETAEAVSTRAGLARRSIAWVGGVSGPSTATALAALAEAHGRTTVLRCALDPAAASGDTTSSGAPADGITAEAATLGIDLHQARLAPDALPELLTAVVRTVVAHEGLDGGAAT